MRRRNIYVSGRGGGGYFACSTASQLILGSDAGHITLCSYQLKLERNGADAGAGAGAAAASTRVLHSIIIIMYIFIMEDEKYHADGSARNFIIKSYDAMAHLHEIICASRVCSAIRLVTANRAANSSSDSTKYIYVLL